MNQNSRRGGQANGNNVEQVRRPATRPAAVVAIVLCVGFAVAMVGIWSCGKPPSQQETQTQPEATVQTETPNPETETPEAETEITEPEEMSPVSVPHRGASGAPSIATPLPHSSVQGEPSTAAPLSQGNPAARQLTDDHVNSPAAVQGDQVNSPTPVQDDQSHGFSHQLNSETVTFEAVNPTTKVPGVMTAAVTGTFRGNRLGDGESSAGSHLEAIQRATFSFVPNDRYSPSYSATVNTLNVEGNTTNNTIHLDFGLETTASDGSSLPFTLREVVTITEDGAQVAFQQLK